MINLPPNFTTDIMANVSQLFNDFSPYITLVLGVMLGVVVIQVLINTITRH